MITQNNRRGRPKGKNAPETISSRVTKFRQNLKDNGGATVTVYLDANELKQIEAFKQQLLLPAKTSRSEVIKGMTCVLGGGVYFTKGHQVVASLDIVERPEYPEWLVNIYDIQ
ncbi:hypothetical protein PZE02_003451 [Salmonella enterica subsp. enterica serovar Vitkin]|uniref:Uncharacterized protein n=3 Tax=Salmonella enterica TaxID=28901 RepID=A0A5Z6P8C4_SALET|nr:hypothetical protein [Salmonella enterica]EBG5369090.1 hypothetical protein [Salmonella enterica subsp. enterica serovar Monschaui]EBH8278973.1 hypothetical protein [Salmonella enterica subsp. enterica serovar Typhimurium str. UK-1]EBP3975264.1 hypothetical protein [Salmonella enterica subsp. enterica]EBS2690431.1 hypothetical protein [Salmonella enterica subsp. enterica serovar Muenchen]EBY0126215.1 hypothetical protein [Salmonella enterica subsp. enterica serovar Vitkin]EBY1916008.1 hypo